MVRERRPIGLFGGTFDPVHLAHLRLAEEARQNLDLAQVIWIPSGQPPHREKPGADRRQRLEMVRLAIAGNDCFTVDGAEVESEEPSYTVLTLQRERRRFGDRSLILLLGADAFCQLDGWHRWRELFELAHLGVAYRPGSEFSADDLPVDLKTQWQNRFLGMGDAETVQQQLARTEAGSIVVFPMTPLDISASQIRALCRHGQSARYLVPDQLFQYIEDRRLYRVER